MALWHSGYVWSGIQDGPELETAAVKLTGMRPVCMLHHESDRGRALPRKTHHMIAMEQTKHDTANSYTKSTMTLRSPTIPSATPSR